MFFLIDNFDYRSPEYDDFMHALTSSALVPRSTTDKVRLKSPTKYSDGPINLSLSLMPFRILFRASKPFLRHGGLVPNNEFTMF